MLGTVPNTVSHAVRWMQASSQKSLSLPKLLVLQASRKGKLLAALLAIALRASYICTYHV